MRGAMGGAHVFVDESKERGYLLIAALLLPSDVAAARKEMDGLRLRGQRRVHFTKESPARRGVILNAIRQQVGAEVVVYDASAYRYPNQARLACLERLVADSAGRGVELLVLEQDDSVLASDRKAVYTYVRKAGCSDTLRYTHRRAQQESLLAIPDAVAWCWAKGGDWRQRVRPLVSAVRAV